MTNNLHNITSAHRISEKSLLDYYKLIYPNRYNALKNNWKWQFRTDFFKNQLPLVLINDKKEILAHLGTIPFKMHLNGKIFDAQWWMDFSVHPNYRRQGLGKLLTKKCMEFADIQITCCNEKAIKIFKSYDWHQSYNSFYHIIWINPTNYKKFYINNIFLKNVVENFSKFIFTKKYASKCFALGDVSIKNITEKDFNLFIKNTPPASNHCYTKKDMSYFKWRFLDSADFDSYKLFKIKNTDIQFIIKINNQNQNNFISVLTQTYTNNHSEAYQSIIYLGSLV